MPEQLVIEPLGHEGEFRVTGELDLLTVPQLREALASATQGGGDIVLDFSGVSFVDSSGLGLLISTAQATHARGGSLVLRTPTHALRRLFGIASPEGIPGLVVEPDQALA